MSSDRDRIPTFPGSGKVVTLPCLGAAVADTHAHLDMLADPVGALVRAARAGVSLVCSVVDVTEEPESTLDGLDGWIRMADEALAAECGDGPASSPDVRLLVGVHPHNARHYDDALHRRLRELVSTLPDDLVAGIGEIGLDYHYEHSPRDTQVLAFRRQLGLAHELGLPVAIHLRAAHDEGLALLEETGVPKAGCAIHCFTEGPETAARFLALSDAVSISFAGPVTFAKATQVREALHVVPLARILVETDSPFLAPAPYRGEANEPAFVVLNAAKVAEELGRTPAEVATACLQNARRLFVRGAEGGRGEAAR